MSHENLNRNLKANDLESALFELKCAADIVGAIQTAIAEGSFNQKSYSDALFGAQMYINNVYRQFEQQIFVEGK